LFIVFKTEASYLLLVKIWIIVLFSFCMLSDDSWYEFILLYSYQIAAILCSLG
jgi:hypothetical protein